MSQFYNDMLKKIDSSVNHETEDMINNLNARIQQYKDTIYEAQINKAKAVRTANVEEALEQEKIIEENEKFIEYCEKSLEEAEQVPIFTDEVRNQLMCEIRTHYTNLRNVAIKKALCLVNDLEKAMKEYDFAGDEMGGLIYTVKYKAKDEYIGSCSPSSDYLIYDSINVVKQRVGYKL